jgi:ATP/ADP translocase
LAFLNKIGRWFNVHDEEIGLFLWTVGLLFLVRSSGIFLNNYAETAFLKRYGVEYMPIVNMVNAVVTFFVMGVMTGFMTRLPGARLLSRLFIFCGLSVACIRAVIPFGIDLIYPALFMLKSQYEVLLALLFWNLANDLFNTRQSKRLFPLITAGGVIGQILGSFATPLVARWLHLDNLLLVYMVTALAGAWAVHAMGKRYPTLLFQQKKEGQKKTRASLIEEFRTVIPMIRSSVLVKILVVLTFMPNVVIPIMNYQFNFAVNEQFATESGSDRILQLFQGSAQHYQSGDSAVRGKTL